MLFDEEEVFKGLTAWFSSSVPESVRSQWGKDSCSSLLLSFKKA